MLNILCLEIIQMKALNLTALLLKTLQYGFWGISI